MRLFIAIEVDDAIRDTLSFVSGLLVRQATAGHPVLRENLHLTLAFIGETKRVQDVLQVLDETCCRQLVEPFELRVSGIGSFPGKRGEHTWWAGLEKSLALESFALSLQAALRETGFAIEKRSFKPHITLGRGVRTERPVILDYESQAMMVGREQIVCYRSDLTGDAPRYSIVF